MLGLTKKIKAVRQTQRRVYPGSKVEAGDCLGEEQGNRLVRAFERGDRFIGFAMAEPEHDGTVVKIALEGVVELEIGGDRKTNRTIDFYKKVYAVGPQEFSCERVGTFIGFADISNKSAPVSFSSNFKE